MKYKTLQKYLKTIKISSTKINNPASHKSPSLA